MSLDKVESTNAVAAQLLPGHPAEGTVISAKFQTAGRGQRGSTWTAEAGANLTFSLILYPHFLAPKQVFLLNKLIACALRETAAALLPSAKVQVKWPNDLLIDGRKAAGILIETTLDQAAIRSAVIGIGFNVNQLVFDTGIHGKATSLRRAAGREFETDVVLADLLERIEAGYLALRAGRFSPVEHAYLQHLYAYQEDTEVEIDGQRATVHVVGVDATGRLAVQQDGKLYFYEMKGIKFCL